MAVRREFDLRTSCAMSQVVGLPLVCSLGASDAVPGSLVRWPSGVVMADGSPCIATLGISVRYEGGLVATLEVVSGDSCPVGSGQVEEAIRSRVSAWEKALTPRTAPLSPVLGELFDRIWLMGDEVDALLPDGQPFARGRLAGLDLWGRVTVVVDGRELELAPEQARLAPAGS